MPKIDLLRMLRARLMFVSFLALMLITCPSCSKQADPPTAKPEKAVEPAPPDSTGAALIRAWKPGATVEYRGTFADEAGHQGPLTCRLTRISATDWSADFAAANEGEGPNKPFKRTGTFKCAITEARVEFVGEVMMTAGGPYVIRAVLTQDGRLTANYERKAGGWPGTFVLRSVQDKGSE